MTLLIWIAIVALVVLGIVGLAVWLFVQVVADIHRQEADLDYWADAPAANKERADA